MALNSRLQSPSGLGDKDKRLADIQAANLVLMDTENVNTSDSETEENDVELEMEYEYE